MSTLTTILSTDKVSDSRAVINDNFDALNDEKLETAGGTITANLIIGGNLTFSGTASYIKVPVLTTTQRNALTPANGFLIYNSTDEKIQCYQNGSWQNLISAGGATVYRTYKLGSEATGADHRTFALDTGTFSDDTSVEVFLNGTLMANGTDADYTTSGDDTIVFNFNTEDADLITIKVIE